MLLTILCDKMQVVNSKIANYQLYNFHQLCGKN